MKKDNCFLSVTNVEIIKYCQNRMFSKELSKLQIGKGVRRSRGCAFR